MAVSKDIIERYILSSEIKFGKLEDADNLKEEFISCENPGKVCVIIN